MDPLQVAGQVTAWVGAAGAAGLALRWLWRASRAVHRLADDLLGDDERPSLMQQVVTLNVDMAAVKAEMHPNHGSSLRDAMDRVERRQQRDGQRLDEHLADHQRV